MNKIAFLFLINDMIINHDLWNTFFDDAINKCNVYVRSKKFDVHNIKLDTKYKIIKSDVKTMWGNSTLVVAEYEMLKYAYDDDINNDKFILCSESCIPLLSFSEIMNTFVDGISYFDNTREYKRNDMHSENNREIVKVKQWFILDRNHVEYIINNFERNYEFLFTVSFPDENYFSTILYQIFKNEIVFRPITFDFFNSKITPKYETFINNIVKNVKRGDLQYSLRDISRSVNELNNSKQYVNLPSYFKHKIDRSVIELTQLIKGELSLNNFRKMNIYSPVSINRNDFTPLLKQYIIDKGYLFARKIIR